MTMGRPGAKGPVILQPPAGGYRVRLSEGFVNSQLGWGLAGVTGDVAFHGFVVEPGEVWCAPTTLKGPSGGHPMARWLGLVEDTSHIIKGVVDDVSELESPARYLVPTRYASFQGAWAQKQFLLKLNKPLASELGWEPHRKVKTANGPKVKARKIAIVPMSGILTLLSADRYDVHRSEPLEQWLDEEL